MRYNINILGVRIREERERIGLSREKLAECIGISPSFLGLVERGDRKLSLEKLCMIAETFNMSIDSFLVKRDLLILNISENNNKVRDIAGKLSTCSEKELEYIDESIQLMKRFLLK